MDTFFNVVFALYLGLFTWLLLIIKKSSEFQVNLIKEQIAKKDATIEHLEHVIKKLYEDTDPVKWKARLDLNRETAEEEIKQLKQLKDSESKKKVFALEEHTKLVTELLSREQELTELQNQYNNLIVISESAKLEKLGAMVDFARRSEYADKRKELMVKFGISEKT